LEVLEEQLEQQLKIHKQLKDLSFATLLTNIRVVLQEKYPDWILNAKDYLPILQSILARQMFDGLDSVIPNSNGRWTVDGVCSLGLISYQEGLLSCPYIWLWLISSTFKDLNFIVFSGYDNNVYYNVWQNWERFNSMYRCLKSVVFNGMELLFSTLHNGMMLNCDPFLIKVKKVGTCTILKPI